MYNENVVINYETENQDKTPFVQATLEPLTNGFNNMVMVDNAAGPPVAAVVSGSAAANGIGFPFLTAETALAIKNGHGRPFEEKLSYLKEEGFPAGLAHEVGRIKSTYPLRFWVLDNSGSMWSDDGRSVRAGKKGRSVVIPCTRWVELRDAVEYHTRMAATLKAPSIFRLLNHPGMEVGPQEIGIAATPIDNSLNHNKRSKDDTTTEQDLQVIENVMKKCQPQGTTALTKELIEVGDRIRTVENILRNNGQKAVLIIATDGLPSDAYEESTEVTRQAFIHALKSLQNLPVWLVIRLCTKDKNIVDFYNNLDSSLEMPLEVIVDLFEEGNEVHTHNPWLNYGLPIHRCREMGYYNRIFDIIDERPLTFDEIMSFIEILFGKERFAVAPDFQSDAKGFIKVLNTVLKTEGKCFNPITEKEEPWINVKELEKLIVKPKSRRSFFGNKKK